MICCKIIADFSLQFDFDKMMKSFAKHGGALYSGQTLYIGSTEKDFEEKHVRSILRKVGLKDFVIFKYNAENQPKEDTRVTAWLEDWLVKMESEYFLQKNNEKLTRISKGLKSLNSELDKAISEIPADFFDSEEEHDNPDGGKN